jgi:hypothetical protein
MLLLIRILAVAATATYLVVMVIGHRESFRPLDIIDWLTLGIPIAGSLIYAFGGGFRKLPDRS